LGGWLATELVRRGANVTALIRNVQRECMLRCEGLPVTVVRGSLSDADAIRRAMCECRVDTVFHLGGQSLVGAARKDPAGAMEANIRGTWNVLEAARHAGVRRVVVASSDKAYGRASRLPCSEEEPMAGESPYEVSKSCADLISRMYAKTYGMAVAIARCANIFGGGDLNFSRVIPGVIRSTLKNERFTIRTDGLFVRDFLYVEDAVMAHLLLAEKLAENPDVAGNGYNFGNEAKMTVLALVALVLRTMERTDLQPIVLNEESSEVREQFMLCEKARRELGWNPRFNFEEGIERTIAWYSDYFARRDGGIKERTPDVRNFQSSSLTAEEYAQPSPKCLSGGSAL
jgi:CDP-glucose 4,6-dehydratase